MYKGEFHIHSRFSNDSLMEPRLIMKRAKSLDFNILSITDHNSIKGSLEAAKYAKEFGIEVWLGMEISTDIGDVIALRISEEIKERRWTDVLDATREQDGISILPHPYRSHKLIDEVAERCDIIETCNGREPPERNARARDLAARLNKPGIAGSDSHIFTELGNAMNVFDRIDDPKKEMMCLHANRLERMYSVSISCTKGRKLRKLPRELIFALTR